MPSYRVEGVDLHVDFDGPADAPLVVFLHGALATGAAFRSQGVALRERFRLAFVDQRGHGRSTHLGPTPGAHMRGREAGTSEIQAATPAPATGGAHMRPVVPWSTLHIDQLTRDAASLLAQLAPQAAVHLVGASMGGLVAARLAAQHPDRVASLALLGTSGTASGKRRQHFARLTPETLPRGTQLLSAKWHGEPYWRDLARHLFEGIVQQTIEVYPSRIRVERALVMQAVDDEVLEPGEAEAWVERIDGRVTLLRPPGDHAFFADGRAGSQAANAALRHHLAHS